MNSASPDAVPPAGTQSGPTLYHLPLPGVVPKESVHDHSRGHLGPPGPGPRPALRPGPLRPGGRGGDLGGRHRGRGGRGGHPPGAHPRLPVGSGALEGSGPLRVVPGSPGRAPRPLPPQPPVPPHVELQVGRDRGGRQPPGEPGAGAPPGGRHGVLLPLPGGLHAHGPRAALLRRRGPGPARRGARRARRLARRPPRRELRLRGLRPRAPGGCRPPRRGLGAGRGHRGARAARGRGLRGAARRYAEPRAPAAAGLRAPPGRLGGPPALLPQAPRQPPLHRPHGAPPGVPGPVRAPGPRPGDPAPPRLLDGRRRRGRQPPGPPDRHRPGPAGGGAGGPGAGAPGGGHAVPRRVGPGGGGRRRGHREPGPPADPGLGAQPDGDLRRP